ncbi:FAD-binding oxidoreductase [Mesorhizobium sp. M0091]|uniref:FAD-binding oxidoreductase n=1 Tax=Mesorhizobium sp. M0091 TaxID=2956875 RepID=UPI003337EBDC
MSAEKLFLCHAPGSNVLEFHIRAVPGGLVSPHLYRSLKSGDRATVAGPKGMAYLRKQHDGPIVFCAGGSGLAPIMSMIRWLSCERVARTARLFFGVRSDEDVYLEAETTHLCTELSGRAPQILLSNASAETARRKGFLAEAIRQELRSCEGMKAYLCGPPIMIETCRAALLELGLKRQDSHADVFWTTTT